MMPHPCNNSDEGLMNNPAREFLVRSVSKITRSLAKIMLRQGISYAMFSEIARGAFVQAAKEFDDIEGRKLSDSRISIITGLSRKEVKRLRDQEVTGFLDDDARHNRAVRVVTAWNRQEKYCTTQRKPRVLPLHGDGPSLSELVSEYGGGVPVRAVVDELSRVGAIVETRPGHWRLANPAYVPNESTETVMKILGTDVPLLVDTINFNLEAKQDDKRFQRKVWYDNITQKDAKRFKTYAAAESFALLKKLDRWLAKHEADPELNPVDSSERIKTGVSVFFFEEPYDDESYKNDE